MPKFAEEKLTAPTMVTQDRTQREITQVVARPVDTYVHPAESKMQQLATALNGFIKSGSAAYEVIEKKQEDHDTTEGAKARMMEGQDSAGVPPPESSKAFQRGYLAVHGQQAGLSVRQQILEAYEANKNKPDFNPKSMAEQIIQQNLQGMQTKEAISGYLQSVTPLTAQVQDMFARETIERMRVESRNTLYGVAKGKTAELGLDGTKHREWFEGFRDLARSHNLSSTDAANLGTEALIAQAIETKDPKWLEAAYAKGKDGRYLAENPELDHKLQAAKKQVEQLQKIQMAEVANEVNKVTAESYARMQADPSVSPEDGIAYVKKNSIGPNSFFNTDDKVKSEISWWLKRNEGLIQTQVFDDLKAKGLLSTGKGIPGFKEYITKDRAPLWQAVVGNQIGTPDSDMAIAKLVDHIAITGEVDDRLSHMMGASILNVPLGKGGTLDEKQIPNDFKLTHRLFTSLKKAGQFPMVEKLMTEDGARIMSNVDRLMGEGMTTAQALVESKKLESPDAKERMARLDKFEQQTLRDSAKGSLSGIFDTGSFGSAANVDGAVDTVYKMAREIYARGSTSPKAALEDALTKYKGSHTIAADHWVELPKGADPKVVTRQLEADIKQFSSDFKVADGALSVFLQPGGKEYMMVDVFTGESKRVPVADLAERGREKAYLSGSQLASVGALVTALDKKQITGQQVNEHWQDINQFFAAGHLNARQYEQFSAMRKDYVRKTGDAKMQEVMEFRRKMAGMVDVGDPMKDTLITDLSRPIPQPGGKNMDTYHYVKQNLKTDPTAALTMMNEGLRLSRYQDPDGKSWDIGFGYNMSARKPEEVKRDLARAGVAPEDIAEVMAGRKSITPQAAVTLYQDTRKQYEANAKKAIGADTWAQLPPNLKAVFTDLSYAAGDAGKFKQAVSAVQKGDFEWLGKNLMIHYTKDGVTQPDWRRIGLLRAMAKGEDYFAAYVDSARNSHMKTGKL